MQFFNDQCIEYTRALVFVCVYVCIIAVHDTTTTTTIVVGGGGNVRRVSEIGQRYEDVVHDGRGVRGDRSEPVTKGSRGKLLLAAAAMVVSVAVACSPLYTLCRVPALHL